MKHGLKLFFASFALVAASVMATAPASAAPFQITDIVHASDADLQAAKARAEAAGDTGVLTLQCVNGIIAYNSTHPANTTTFAKPVGPVDAIVAAHLVARGVLTVDKDFVPVELKAACGGLALEVQEDAARAARFVIRF